MRRAARQDGFSAIELTIACMIVGAIAAVAIPNALTATRAYTLQIAAQALEQQLNRCRQEAVRANQTVKIKISAHTSVVDVNRNTIFTDDGLPTTLSDSATIVVDSPSTTAGVITFTSRGEVPIGDNPSFTVKYGSMCRTVSVDPRGAVTVGPEHPL